MRAILTYHSIDSSGSPISCHPDAFDRHLAWLASGRVQVASIDDLVRLPPSADAVALTFDDGFSNFGDHAAPRLLAHGLPVTLFVVAGLAGGRNVWDDGPRRRTPDLPLLDWPALVRLQEQGVTLGAHGLTHRPLPGLSAGELDDELHECARNMEEQSGRAPSTFAYPYGAWNPTVGHAVARVFRWACTTEFRLLEPDAAPLALPRVDMFYFQRPGSLDDWGTRAFRTRIGLRHSLRRARVLAGSIGGRHGD